MLGWSIFLSVHNPHVTRPNELFIIQTLTVHFGIIQILTQTYTHTLQIFCIESFTQSPDS